MAGKERVSYKHIERDLRRRIEEHTWKVNEKIPPCRVLADQYGASVNTVEKAIRQLAEEGYLMRQARVGTVVNSIPTKRSPSRLVLASVHSVDNPLWMKALRGMEDVLREKGYAMLAVSNDRNIEKIEKVVGDLEHANIAGMLIAPVFSSRSMWTRFAELVERLQNQGLPVVFVDRYMPDMPVPYVTTDNMSGAYRLTKLMIERGHRKLLYISHRHISSMEERLTGFRQACYDLGINDSDIHSVCFNTTEEDFQNEYAEVARKLEKTLKQLDVTAVIAANDQNAKLLMDVLNRMGKRVPQDMSVATYDAGNLPKPYADLTGVNQNVYEMGRAAAQTLIRIMNNGDTAQYGQRGIIVSSEIVITDSVRTLHAGAGNKKEEVG